jgi:hypothetical protein
MVVGVGEVGGAVHRPVLRVLALHVAVAGELVLELGLGDARSRSDGYNLRAHSVGTTLCSAIVLPTKSTTYR